MPIRNRPANVLRALTAVIQNTNFRPRGLGATLTSNIDVPGPYPALILSDRPVAYNRLNEGMGTTAIDYTGHGHDGVLSSGITPGLAGAIAGDPGTTMFLDGSTAWIDCPTMGAMANFTLEAWGYTTSTAAQCIMAQVDGGFLNASFWFIINNDSGFATATGTYVDILTPALSMYVWHHLVLTYNGATLTYYVDGIVAASGAASGMPQSITPHTVIGRTGDHADRYWSGALQEVAVYDYALNAVQIKAHYVEGTRPQQKNQPDTKPYTFGTLNSLLARAAIEAGAGVNSVSLALGWDIAEPTEGVFNGSYLYQIQQSALECKAQGMAVVLGVELHNPPDWVFGYADSHYVNQFGGTASQVNLIFNQVLRTKASAFLTQINTAVGLSNFSAIRITGGGDGECLFPPEDNDGVHTNAYWAYDANALNGPNLPVTIGANPLPTFTPGGAFTSGQAQTWYTWYLSALVDEVNWLIQQYKTLGFTGQFHVLTPGLGNRPDEYTSALTNILNGTGDNNATMGRGAVWDKFYAALPDRVGVVAYCSSMADGSGAPADNISQPSDNSVAITDTQIDNWSAARWLRYIANLYSLPMAGENPGSLTQYVTMVTCAAQMRAGGMQGMYWAHDNDFYDLFADSTLTQYSALIHQYNWQSRPKVVRRALTGTLFNTAYQIRGLSATLVSPVHTPTRSTALRTLVRTISSKAAGLRIAVGTQVSASSRLRAIVATMATRSAGLRTLVRSQKIVSVGVRVPTRTQVTCSAAVRVRAATQKVASSGVRTTVRSLSTKVANTRIPVGTRTTLSSVFRALVRSLKSASTPIRTVVRSQVTKSTVLRAVIRGISLLTSLRVPVRALHSLSLSLRTRVRTMQMVQTVLRAGVRTRVSVPVQARALVRTLAQASSPLRTRVRSQVARSVALRTLVRQAMSLSLALRAVVGTVHSLTAPLRTQVRTQVTRSLALRLALRGLTRVMGLRLPVAVRIVLSVPLRLLTRTQTSTLVRLSTLARTARSLVVALRAFVSTRVQRSIPLRTLVQAKQTLSIHLRVIVTTIGQLVTRFALVRVLVRTGQRRLTSLRTSIMTQRDVGVALRAVIRGVTFLTALRLPVAVQQHLSTPLRTSIRSTSHALVSLRSRVHTKGTVFAHIRAGVRTKATRLVAVRVVAKGTSYLTTLRVHMASRHVQLAVVRTLVHHLGAAHLAALRTPIASRSVPLVGLRTIATIPVGVRGSIDPPLGSFPTTYQGQNVVPTRPSGVYAVNGVILDSQPTICTAPLVTSGVRFLIGSTFFLFFDRPTTLTQTLLADGQTVSMTFALSTGQMVTGRVQVASTLVAATSLSVVCTLLSPVTLSSSLR